MRKIRWWSGAIGCADGMPALRAPDGIAFMGTATTTSIRRAPWGRKGFLAPLPILSVVLMVTAMAAPGLLHMTVTILNDTNLTITAQVQNVVHPSGPTGKILGIVTVTNHASTATRITVATARIQSLRPGSGFPDGRLDTNITISVPLLVPAGARITVSLSGPFSGNVLKLTTTDSFLITPMITWISIPSSGSPQGPFTYSQVKVCTGQTSPTFPYWDTYCSNA